MSAVGLRGRRATGLIDIIVVWVRGRDRDYVLAALLPVLPFIAVAAGQGAA